MFILHLPDKDTALLLLYYAKFGAEQSLGVSYIEAPRVLKISKELISSIKGE